MGELQLAAEPTETDDDERTFGTVAPDAPVTRAELERALRSLNTHDMLIRDHLLQLAAQVVALTDELTRRLDGIEPATPWTPPEPEKLTLEVALARTTPEILRKVRANDASSDSGASYDLGGDKYETTPSDVPCAELLSLCQARCCKLRFSLSTQDLDEGIIRWDYGQPYLIRQRASDRYCVHNDPDTRFCTVREARPRVCRKYDCRNDERIWLDYEARIPAPEMVDPPAAPAPAFDLLERARTRTTAVIVEHLGMGLTCADREPKRGPKP
jgi:Fe-S-cluster containining protein